MGEIINKLKITHALWYSNRRFEQGYAFEGHRHNQIELNVVFDGVMKVNIENIEYKLEKNFAILIPPYAFHNNVVASDDGVNMMVFIFKVEDVEKFNSPLIFELDSTTERILSIFCERMNKSQDKSGSFIRIINDSEIKLMEAFLICSEQLNFVKRENSPDIEIYSIAIDYMLSKIRSTVAVDEIAKVCNVSKTKIERVFYKFAEKGCNAYFNELKIEKARAMLKNGKSCSYVSDYFGYSSPAYFSKVFKKFYGFPPSLN